MKYLLKFDSSDDWWKKTLRMLNISSRWLLDKVDDLNSAINIIMKLAVKLTSEWGYTLCRAPDITPAVRCVPKHRDRADSSLPCNKMKQQSSKKFIKDNLSHWLPSQHFRRFVIKTMPVYSSCTNIVIQFVTEVFERKEDNETRIVLSVDFIATDS